MLQKSDIERKRFGKLVAVSFVASRLVGGKKRRFWSARCDCGRKIEVDVSALRSGNTKSCGVCVKGTHRKSTTPTYRIWANVLSRCRDKNNEGYYLYGGRGIRVCKRWEKFENFLADMGERPKGKSIDRIDGEGNYEPGNCRWATPREQAQHRRDTKLSFDIADEMRELFAAGVMRVDIARLYGVSLPAVLRVCDGSRWVRGVI